MWPKKASEETTTDPKKPEERTSATPEPLSADALKAMFAEAAQPILQRVEELSKSNAEMREKFESIEKAASKPTKAAESDEPTDFFVDPEKAFRERISPVLLENYMTRAQLVEAQISAKYRDKYPEFMEAYGDDVDKIIADTPVVQKAQYLAANRYPEFVENVFKLVVGAKAVESGLKVDKKSKKLFLGESAGPGAEETETRREDEGMTQEQARIFRRMGVPMDKAKETMGKLKFVS